MGRGRFFTITSGRRRRWRRRPAPVMLEAAVVWVAALALMMPGLPAGASNYVTTEVNLASGPSPFADCDISGDIGTNYVNSEVEPWMDVNPTDASNAVAVWQQDRWSNGGARGLVTGVSHDDGQSWSETFVPFSKCAGGTEANGGDFDRSSDPWVTFAPNGDVYQIALQVSFFSTTETGIAVSKSTDGGDSWSDPAILARDDFTVAPFLFHDKESITADPFDSSDVYAIWDRSRFPSDSTNGTTGFSHAFRGDIMFSRTTDGGQSWEPTREIFEPRDNEFTIGNQIVVLPDGTLVDIFDHGQGSGNNRPGFDMRVIRSTDQGLNWSDQIVMADERAVTISDPETGIHIRNGAGLPDIAADLNPDSPGYGNLYAVWSDSLTKKPHATINRIAFTMSTDGGLTWSPLVAIDQTPAGLPSFTPSVHVASDGTVAVTYYDFRSNTPDPGLLTDMWMIHCHPETDCTNPSNWAENHVDGPFDLEKAPVTGSRGYFIGDYEGLASVGTDVLPFFAETTETDPANVYFARVEQIP